VPYLELKVARKVLVLLYTDYYLIAYAQ